MWKGHHSYYPLSPEIRRLISHLKGTRLVPGGQKTSLLPQIGNLGPKRLCKRNLLLHNILPQAQIPLSRQFFKMYCFYV